MANVIVAHWNHLHVILCFTLCFTGCYRFWRLSQVLYFCYFLLLWPRVNRRLEMGRKKLLSSISIKTVWRIFHYYIFPDWGGEFTFFRGIHIINGWHIHLHKTCDDQSWTAGIFRGVQTYLKLIKRYLCYKMVTSQNMPSEAQVNFFFIS